MPQVAVTIDGRNYLMACDEGEEPHLQALAARLDFKVAEMRVRFGQIGDTRILVMAALTIADEASAAEQRLRQLASPDADSLSHDAVDALARTLDDLVRRIERAAALIANDENGVG